MMTQSKTSNYTKNKVTRQLEVLIAIVQQLLYKKKEEAYSQQNLEKCYKCEKSRYITGDCMSEKVLST